MGKEVGAVSGANLICKKDPGARRKPEASRKAIQRAMEGGKFASSAIAHRKGGVCGFSACSQGPWCVLSGVSVWLAPSRPKHVVMFCPNHASTRHRLFKEAGTQWY